MGQPTPPGDNVPLYDGLGPEWNDIVGALPEDRRGELAPRIKERLGQYEPLKQWQDFQRSGITPDHASAAINLFSIIENNPRQVLDTLAKHLGLTVAEAAQAVQQLETQSNNADDDDPRFQTMQQQLDTLAQIALAQRNMSQQEQAVAQQEAALDKELSDLKNKYGDDVNEQEIVMRMLHRDMTAEQAYQDYARLVGDIRKRPATPMLLGSNGGVIPQRNIDPTKLNSADTKDLVAQMMAKANAENKR